MNLNDVDIDALVPQRRPMRLIDEILGVEDDVSVSAATVTPQWPMLNNDAASPIVLIELVAQTAAALGGLKARQQNAGNSGNRGLIVGIKSASFFIDEIPLHSRIVTRATTRLLIENFKEITGTAQICEVVVAEITLQSVSY